MTSPPPETAPGDGSGRKPDWLVLTASERGASHLATGAPNQDAVASERAGTDGVVGAVADGHGHSRHLRSARGSRIAARIGCQVAQELADRIEAQDIIPAQLQDRPSPQATASALTGLVKEFLVPAIVNRWRAAVLADAQADPFTDSEQDQRLKGDDPAIAYGSTLLLGIALRGWLVLAQIGDGDVVGVRTDGGVLQPVPVDPQLDGLVTTSLCGPSAQSDFRVAVVDTVSTPLLAVLLATDGYGNAQVVEEWPRAFSEDLAWMLRDRDAQWLASQLPSWTARCASSEGSADDTSVALLLGPTAATRSTRPGGPGRSDLDPGTEETTIPAMPHADTVPSAQVPTGQRPIEPVTVRQQPITASAGPQVPPGPQVPAEHSGPATEEISISDQATAKWEPPRSNGAGAR